MDSGITPLNPEQTAQAESVDAHDNYGIRLLIALDMFLNALFNGDLDETLSSRSARAAQEGKLWGKLLSHFLDLFQKDHGAKAQAGDYKRASEVEYLEAQSGDIKP